MPDLLFTQTGDFTQNAIVSDMAMLRQLCVDPPTGLAVNFMLAL